MSLRPRYGDRHGSGAQTVGIAVFLFGLYLSYACLTVGWTERPPLFALVLFAYLPSVLGSILMGFGLFLVVTRRHILNA